MTLPGEDQRPVEVWNAHPQQERLHTRNNHDSSPDPSVDVITRCIKYQVSMYRHLHARDADGRGIVHVELPPPPHRLLVQPAGRRCRGLQ